MSLVGTWLMSLFRRMAALRHKRSFRNHHYSNSVRNKRRFF